MALLVMVSLLIIVALLVIMALLINGGTASDGIIVNNSGWAIVGTCIAAYYLPNLAASILHWVTHMPAHHLAHLMLLPLDLSLQQNYVVYI